MFYSNFERKNYKALTFNIVHFANFETLTPSSNKRRIRIFLIAKFLAKINILKSRTKYTIWVFRTALFENYCHI